MNDVKKFLKERKFAIITVVSLVAPLVSTVTAHASVVGVADSSVTTAFDGMQANVIATMGPVAIGGIAIMGIFLGWKYGKKLFSRVAN